MNENNFTYLADRLKYLGFGEGHGENLRAAMASGIGDFTLSHEALIQQRAFRATLFFHKGAGSDHYYLNKWEGVLPGAVGVDRHTFYIQKGHGVTLKEGFNLLEGRSVYKNLTTKEGEKYEAWLQLDKKGGEEKLRQFHSAYGFDLDKVLSRLPISELATAEGREALLKSLQRGNLQGVTFEKEGFVEKLWVEASPQFKSVNVYNSEGEKLTMGALEKRFEFGKPDVSQQAPAQTSPSREAEGVTKKEGVSQKITAPSEGEGLLPKKRIGSKKGLQP
jgi:hypothetical protein